MEPHLKCPTCFHLLPEDVTSVACLECPPERPERLADIYGVDRSVPRVVPKGTKCDQGHWLGETEACPRCHSPVPQEWREDQDVRVTCVALVGARTTGKSTYIGVVDRQLEILIERHGSHLERLAGTETYYDEAFGDALFKHKLRLEPTAVAEQNPYSHRALMYRFRDETGRRRILVLRDVAGEDLEGTKTAVKPQLDFLTRADGLIVLLDPLNIPDLRDVLPGTIDHEQIGGDGVSVLESLLRLLGNLPPQQRKDIPLAVTLAKIDLIWKAKDVEGFLPHLIMQRTGSPLVRDPSMRSLRHDGAQGGLLHEEIRSLLRKTMGGALDNLLRERNATHQYFAVSALGAHTSGDNIAESGISPFRVLDPIKWMMTS